MHSSPAVVTLTASVLLAEQAIKFGDREYVVSSRIETRDDFCDCYVETAGGEEHSDEKPAQPAQLAQLGLVTKKLTVQSSRDDSQKKLRKGKEEVEGRGVGRKYDPATRPSAHRHPSVTRAL